MSVTIRLARIGRKNLPAYRLVASTTRDKRNGRFLDILGHYNPSGEQIDFAYDKDRLDYWKKNGAIISNSVQKLVEGKYIYKPYKKGKGTEENTNDSSAEGSKASE